MGAPSTANVKQYKDTIYLLAQQMLSYIRPTVAVDTNFRGEQKFYEQYSTDNMVELSGYLQDTPVQTPNHARRMVIPRFFVSNTLEDPIDALQMIIDPKSAYMQAKIAAAGRQTDDVIISAFGATASTGKTGSDSTVFGAGMKIVYNYASGSTGMNKLKAIEAKTLLDKNEVEPTDRFMACGASQIADLLNTTEVTSSDFNIVKALVQGELNTWLGFTWVRTERLLADGSSNRLCYAYHRMAMQLAIQQDIVGRLDERPDKNYAWQVYLKMCMGATRLEENRIAEIACTEVF